MLLKFVINIGYWVEFIESRCFGDELLDVFFEKTIEIICHLMYNNDVCLKVCVKFGDYKIGEMIVIAFVYGKAE